LHLNKLEYKSYIHGYLFINLEMKYIKTWGRTKQRNLNVLETVISFELNILSMALHSVVGPWPLFQFLDLIHSRYDFLDGGSARRRGLYLHTKQHKHT
jgi:hypothetical protein